MGSRCGAGGSKISQDGALVHGSNPVSEFVALFTKSQFRLFYVLINRSFVSGCTSPHRSYIFVRLTDGTARIFTKISLFLPFPLQVTYFQGFSKPLEETVHIARYPIG